MTKTEIQIFVEQNFSKRHCRDMIEEDLDRSWIKKIVDKLYDYAVGEYYESKMARIRKMMNTPMEDIAESLMIASLTSTEMRPIQSVIGLITPVLDMDRLDGVKTVAEILAVCENLGLYELYHESDYRNNTGTLALQAKYKVSKEVRSHLEHVQYLPPMVTKPRLWKQNAEGGFMTVNDSVILGKDNHHWEKQALDVLNILQDIELCINEAVYELEEDSSNIPVTKLAEKQFVTYRDEAVEVHKYLLDEGNSFYFPWRLDKRGRMYSQGYHLNLQGREYQKALIDFKQERVITN